MRMANEVGLVPPYASYSSWVRLMGALAESLPPTLGESYMASLEFSESSIKALRSALRFLGLVERDSRPTEKLRSLTKVFHNHSGTGRTDALKEICLQAYGPLLSSDSSLSSASTTRLKDYFGSLGAHGQIQQKCTTFFLNLVRDAGLGLPPQLASRARSPLRQQRIAPVQFRTVERRPAPSVIEPSQRLISAAEVSLLMGVFPRFDLDWPEEKKQKWFRDLAKLMRLSEYKGEFLSP